MRRYDLSPLLRSSIGFDRFDRLFDAAERASASNGYPPYNITKSGENAYAITMAVAGFREDELDITVKEGSLVVTGRREDEPETATYLHRGIAARNFERRFTLAEDVQVIGAKLENGLLNIDLERQLPEHKRPRQVEITSGSGERQAA